jgi:hypothetical protein
MYVIYRNAVANFYNEAAVDTLNSQVHLVDPLGNKYFVAWNQKLSLEKILDGYDAIAYTLDDFKAHLNETFLYQVYSFYDFMLGPEGRMKTYNDSHGLNNCSYPADYYHTIVPLLSSEHLLKALRIYKKMFKFIEELGPYAY